MFEEEKYDVFESSQDNILVKKYIYTFNPSQWSK